MTIRNLTFSFLALGLLGCANEEPASTREPAKSPPVDTIQEEHAAEDLPVILFFGNSLTEGYGVEEDQAFPARIQQRLDSLGYNYRVVNAGVSGETSAAGVNRIDWVLKRQNVDIFVLELGANDGLRGLPPRETYENLSTIIDKVRAVNPDVQIILAGMQVPPNMGADYSNEYRKIFPRLANEKEVDLIPFLLEDVGGVDSLNQSDGIHPNAEGTKLMAETVWRVLKDHLEK